MDNLSIEDQERYNGKVAGKNRRHQSSGICSRPCSRIRMAGFSLVGLILISAVVAVSCVSVLNEDETSSNAEPIRVGAFNIKHFGKSLMSDEKVVSSIVKIFHRYDVMLVQEVRDSSHSALKDLNNRLTSTGEMWSFISSDKLGRSKYYKEQYVFFYKNLRVKYMGSHQVNDSVHDVYEREPFAVNFEYTSVSSKSKEHIILAALHTKPTDAKEELKYLPRTIKSLKTTFPHALGVITLGDFNADCSYLSHSARGELDIFNTADFVSLIPDDADTAVSPNRDCAYDRVIVYGDQIDYRQASVFKFETYLHLNEEDAAEVSDHYPVEFLLY